MTPGTRNFVRSEKIHDSEEVHKVEVSLKDIIDFADDVNEVLYSFDERGNLINTTLVPKTENDNNLISVPLDIDDEPIENSTF